MSQNKILKHLQKKPQFNYQTSIMTSQKSIKYTKHNPKLNNCKMNSEQVLKNSLTINKH